MVGLFGETERILAGMPGSRRDTHRGLWQRAQSTTDDAEATALLGRLADELGRANDYAPDQRACVSLTHASSLAAAEAARRRRNRARRAAGTGPAARQRPDL